MPRPGTQVIPDGWSEHVRPTVNKTMTAKVVLQRPSSESVFNETAGHSEYPDPVVLWTGSARLQRYSSRRGGEQQTGGRFVVEQLYQISTVADGMPEAFINDQILVLEAADDPVFVGKLLRIREVRRGSLIWSQDMLAEETTPTTR